MAQSRHLSFSREIVTIESYVNGYHVNNYDVDGALMTVYQQWYVNEDVNEGVNERLG